MVLQEAEDYIVDLLAQVRAAPPRVRVWLRGVLEELLRVRDEIHVAREQRASELKQRLLEGEPDL